MSYIRKTSVESTEEFLYSPRKNQRASIFDSDCNINGNNNTDNIEMSNGSVSVPDSGKRFSVSKSSGRSRKSKLIEAMAANFEKKNCDNTHVKSNATRRSIPNGDVKLTPTIIEPPKDGNNNAEHSPSDEEKPSEEHKKVSPSARRGKSQRNKRMIRQKRRSTGVVNKEDLGDMEQTDVTEADENLQRQTSENTQTNELSPTAIPPSNDRVLPSEHIASSKRTENSSEPPDLIQSTPRRGGNKQVTSELEELRAKLEIAESTMSKLRQEIKIMDKELHVLEEENDQLKADNKMLEDENRTMLRIIRSQS